MQVKRESLNGTSVKLTITADQVVLDQIKTATLRQLSQNVRVPGFRPGKAPDSLIEKHLDQSLFQSEFLDQAMNHLYIEAIQHEKLRPVIQPEVSVTKFVPFTTLEFVATVEAIGTVTLPDYRKIKLEPKATTVTAKDVDQVLDNLRTRGAAKSEVKRAAKIGDEVVVDFTGVDAKTKELISGADGQDYALVLGSKTLIPGFEDKLVGVKPGEKTEFTLTFPKDYSTKALQNRKVTFSVTVQKVQAVTKAKLDDAFAATIGPFKNIAELEADIKKQLTAEQKREQQQAYDSQLLEKISDKSTVAIPTALIEEEIDRMEDEEKRNIVFRGQTWQEHLDQEGLTPETHREKQREGARLRVKAGLILAEVADQEEIAVSPEELEIRIQLLKGQYTDKAMQDELDKPENRRDIMNRLLSEKTLDKLRGYAQAK